MTLPSENRERGNTLAELFSKAIPKEKGMQEGKEHKEDLNVLPLPAFQDIVRDRWMKWTWVDQFGLPLAYGTLYLAPHDGIFDKGDYEVELCTNARDDILSYTSDQAKAVGQALISAAGWKDIWKQHAGTFIERELLGDKGSQ